MVHDEIILEVPEKLAGEAAVILKETMIQAGKAYLSKGVATRYIFTIDNRLRLPVQVEEFSPEGAPRRRVVFEDLKVNTGIPESVFTVE